MSGNGKIRTIRGEPYELVVLRPCEWDFRGRPTKAEIGYEDTTFQLDDPTKANEFVTAFVKVGVLDPPVGRG